MKKIMKIKHMFSGLSKEHHVAYKVKNFVAHRYISNVSISLSNYFPKSVDVGRTYGDYAQM